MIMDETIEQLIENLARARILADWHKGEVEIRTATVKRSELYLRLARANEKLKQVQQVVDDCDEKLRAAILKDHQATGEKHYSGAEVKFFTVIKYNDQDAVDYCIEHDISAALKLDHKQFEKAAEVLRPGFVVAETEPRVYIDKDLSKFLEVQDETEVSS